MNKKQIKKLLESLPADAADFLKLVIKKMKYRKKVRAEVLTELAAHFEDELKDCKNDDEKQNKVKELIEEFGDPKILGILLRRAKKRCRSLWRTIVARTFQTIGILLLSLFLYSLYIISGQPSINIDYTKETLKLARPVADESLNAANLYQKAIDAYKEPPNIENEDLTRTLKGKKWIDELTSQQLDSLKKYVNDNAQATVLFTQASKKPYYWLDKSEPNNHPFIHMLLPELAPTRDIAKMIVWQAKLKAYTGDIEGAFDDIFTLYRSGQHLKGPKVLIEQLVGISMQAMAVETSRTILTNTNIDLTTLQNIQRKFTDLRDRSTFIVDFKIEKFLLLDFVQRCYTDNGRGSGHLIPRMASQYYGALDIGSNHPYSDLNFIPFLGMAVVSADRKQITKMCDKYYDTFQKHAHKSPWQLNEENVDFKMGINQWSLVKQLRYFPFTYFMPALERVNMVMHRSKADVDSLITTIVILRFQKQKGVYPESLQQLLDENFINQIPADPFSDKPLVYKKTEDSFILYSLSENFTDEGGEGHKNDEGEIKKWGKTGDAIFWPVIK
ncbi:MAG: hypothetical protein FVQ80_04120 [Planctomycetes bacterium]|nr:hypothetical protein [Planctomycetota bacterium]